MGFLGDMADERPENEAGEPAKPEPLALETLKAETVNPEPAELEAAAAAPMADEPAKAEPPPPELAKAEAQPAPSKAELAPDLDIPLLRIEGVAKKFGNFRAVDQRLARYPRWRVLCPAWVQAAAARPRCLRMLAGFETPDEGRILLDGMDIAPVLPHERPVNMMFQNYALFPHLSVRDNIAFGLKRAGMARADIADRVAEMVALVKLEGLEKRKPDQLSGGQRQRVALARSLARRPQVLLLDEPLAALDKKLRESTQHELMELQRRLGMTFIIVTHDQEEAMTMASRIGVMDAGRLDQVATPRELYEAPASRWIAEFVGDINLFEGEVQPARAGSPCHRDARRRHDPCRRAAHTARKDRSSALAIRPEKVKLSRRGPVIGRRPNAHAINRLEGVITDVSYLGGLTTYKVKLDSGAIIRSSMANTARIDIDAYSAGQRVVAWFTPDDCLVLEQ